MQFIARDSEDDELPNHEGMKKPQQIKLRTSLCSAASLGQVPWNYAHQSTLNNHRFCFDVSLTTSKILI
jgi:hypothetical protein